MNNSTDTETFETGGAEQSHLFQPPESVSGSESEDKRMAKMEHLTPNVNSSPGEGGQPSKRTLQNRKAQREFRERKASYVKSLEHRIRAYESNEVQGNVELQRAARRLKEENEQLREEVRQLRERLAIVEGNGAMAAMPPARTPGRSRGGGAASHQPQSSQPTPQALYNQPQGFSNDVTAYDMMSSAPTFPGSTNPQGYPQYFAQQQHYNSYPQHQPIYGQEGGDVSLNPDLRRTPGRGDNAPGRSSSAQ